MRGDQEARDKTTNWLGKHARLEQARSGLDARGDNSAAGGAVAGWARWAGHSRARRRARYPGVRARHGTAARRAPVDAVPEELGDDVDRPLQGDHILRGGLGRLRGWASGAGTAANPVSIGLRRARGQKKTRRAAAAGDTDGGWAGPINRCTPLGGGGGAWGGARPTREEPRRKQCKGPCHLSLRSVGRGNLDGPLW